MTGTGGNVTDRTNLASSPTMQRALREAFADDPRIEDVEHYLTYSDRQMGVMSECAHPDSRTCDRCDPRIEWADEPAPFDGRAADLEAARVWAGLDR